MAYNFAHDVALARNRTARQSPSSMYPAGGKPPTAASTVSIRTTSSTRLRQTETPSYERLTKNRHRNVVRSHCTSLGGRKVA